MDYKTKPVCRTTSSGNFAEYFTIRIHLDETNSENGALKVIEKSHSKGIYRPETIDWKTEKESICSVNKGGIMIMKPLFITQLRQNRQ